MCDYRDTPEDSPYVWCAQCQKLIQNSEGIVVMKTVYRVEPHGVYPFGLCREHQTTTTIAG